MDNDTISRQAAIDALDKRFDNGGVKFLIDSYKIAADKWNRRS